MVHRMIETAAESALELWNNTDFLTGFSVGGVLGVVLTLLIVLLNTDNDREEW